MTCAILDGALISKILYICKKAAPNDIVAASIYDSHVKGYPNKDHVNVLLILNSQKLTLKYSLESLKEVTVSLLVVDQKTFEKDVDSDWLGGILIENMLIPYEPLINRNFLWDQEVRTKKRIIIEILGNLVLLYPHMCRELLIKPEYFMFEAMARKASLYPPISSRFLNMLRSDQGGKNKEVVMKGFKAALEAVTKEELVTTSDGYIKITKRFIDTIERRQLRVLSLLKTVRDSILRHSLEVFPKMMRSLLEDYSIYTKHLVSGGDLTGISLSELEDPKRYIVIPTASGLVSLSDKITIEDFVKRNIQNGHNLKVNIEKLGGALNAVFILRIHKEKEEQNIVVKVFKNWYGLKWFPLALWSIGTRGFAVLGKSRLEKEYAMNRFLSAQGFNVPRIIHVSPKEGLIFQEYIEGESLTMIIKQVSSTKEKRDARTEAIRHVGREIAKVHKSGVGLGDCKPENIIITKDGKIYFLDLEQAERGGDQAWDVAELLYYSGHYASFSPVEVVQMIARKFIEGYLEAGGKIENIRKARSPRYVKVFSFFTFPHVLFVISSTCGERLKGEESRK
jgi:tRNA A-37 threonylcarbamoyl transferase component Bud32